MISDFCGSVFWDSELTWNTNNPYFTPCFEATTLTLIPLLFLLVFGFIDVFTISKSKSKHRTFLSSLTILPSIKLFLSLTLIALQLSQVLRFAIEADGLLTVDYLSPTLLAVGYVMALVLSLMLRFYMLPFSGVQYFFWLGTVVTQAILFRTAVVNYKDVDEGADVKLEIIYLTRLISFPVVTVRFLLEWFNDELCEKRDSNIKLGKPSPEKTSTFISKLFFLWYDNLAWTGYRRTLTKDDLWDLNPDDTSRVQIDKFSKHWAQEKVKAARRTKETGKKSFAGILNPLFKSYGFTFAIGIVFRLTSDMLVFIQPQMLRLIVAHVTSPGEEPVWRGFFYVGLICLASISQSLLNASSSKRVQLAGMRVKTAISNAVFRKALVISNAAKKESSVGEIVNLQSVDSGKLMEFLMILNVTLGGPFQIIMSVVLLYNTLGPSVFAGVGVLVAVFPVNMFLVTISRKHQMEQMRLKDERIKLTSEVMNGIKVLKLYAWESAYQEQIEAIRQREMVCLRKILNLNVFSTFILQCTPVLVSLASFVTFVLSDPENNILDAGTTFVSISLFNIMRLPMAMLPMLFSASMQASVSMKRLNKFLNMEELDTGAVTHSDSYKDRVVIDNGTFSWTPEATTLKNINFTAKEGELVAVVGPIGSGKTSLLSALLGDLTKHSGLVNTKGDLAYVSQTAWIQNATVRDNILFGDKFNQARYTKSVSACALETDLQMLSSGDQTEIGEKGINLSGGQKQRVALARAAYKEADIYLFDDPLSAVDSHVGKHIFDNLIGPTGMLKNKTRVLVTHGVSFLPRVDRIFVMKNGQISETGTYKQLLMRQGEFAEFLLTHLGVESDEDIDPDKMSIIQDLEEAIAADMVQRRSSVNRESLTRILQRLPSKDKIDAKLEKPEEKPEVAKKLVEEEVSAEGNIKLSIFLDYFKSAGIFMSVLAVGFAAATNGLTALTNIWLSSWSSQATKDEEATGTALQATTDKYLMGYGLIGGAMAVASLISTVALSVVNISATRSLHAAALSRVLRSPMSYFDTTLMGRLINRFSKDVDTLDNLVPMNLRTFLFMFFNVLFTFIVISYTTPIFIGFIIPMAILYFFLQRFYVATSRQLKRLEGVTRSPIYSHFGETISGSSIIRAFHLEEDFIAESEKRVDLNQKSYFPFVYSSIWITIRLEFIGVLVILFTCIFILISGNIDPGLAGLAISSSLQITTFLNFLARQMSELEANIVSVERVGELTQTPQEPAWEISESKPSPSWPENGKVVFSNYMTRYREGLELVLRGISCTIESGEKIGVVGRTGAGKSSLTLALFRIVESAGGQILIDGIDISKLGLHDLRKKITIIPQDPVLFSGNLRLNLDPFDQYTDDQVWHCLELAHLKSHIVTLHEGLQYKVEEEGQNFSVGQRQLICLARALLRKTKILILDEATAAVDLETDDLIQATIRKEFADCTVLTIAHRLNTIMDSSRVLVLDKGGISEFDSPENLLEDTNSMFWKMAKDAKLV